MLKRLPTSQAILQVFAVIVVLLSGWTIIAFLWRLSAWLLILNLGEIFAIFSYGMLVNFIESLIVILFLLVLCVLLPPHILRDDFTVRGTILAIGIIGSLMAFVKVEMELGIQSGVGLFIGPLAVMALTLLLLSSLSKTRFVSTAILWISDRLTVFLFILLPLFVFLSVYVIFRNFV